MSANYEKEKRNRTEKKTRESSIARKPRAEDPNDRRPIITQEKVPKQKAVIKERGKSQTKRTDHDDERKSRTQEKRSSKEGQNTGPVKTKRVLSMDTKKYEKDSKLEAMYLKDLLEKRGVKKKDDKKKEKKEVEEDEKKARSRRDRTRTRTLSPTEVKQLVRQPSNIGIEIGGGDASGKETKMKKREDKKEVEKKEEEKEEAVGGGNEEEYEDDFEDYNSDFEEESNAESEIEVEEERRTETSSYTSDTIIQSREDVVDPWKKTIRKQELEDIKKCIEKENKEMTERRKSVSIRREEEDFDKENNFRGWQTTEQLINFSSASKRLKNTKKAEANKRRGEELLNMITLDTISYNILEVPPIPYEEFMKAFGKSNTKQVHVQTNEDNLDEEIQTEEIIQMNKWTQNPAEYLGSKQKSDSGTSYMLTKEERLGVGGDTPLEDEIIIHSNSNALSNFLSWASQMVLTTLEKKSGNFLSLENMPNHSKAMAFGDGFISLNVNDIPFLKGRSVAQLCLLPKNAGKLLSVHVNKEKSFQKCMICVWSFRELSKPLKILLSSNQVTSCCFGLNLGNLVFAGLSDGSICLWDLREPTTYHNKATNSPEWTLQSPTYTTAANMRDNGHRSPIVAVRLLSKVDVNSGFGDFTPIQICSLDKDGTTIIWTVIQLEKAQRNAPNEDLGLAHWGRVKLVKSSTFSVFASLRDEIPGLYITCNDLFINEAEDNGFYIANSLGSVHHCSSYGSLMKPKFYVPSKQDAIIETTCLELCPFNGNYFLVGCGDGSIRWWDHVGVAATSFPRTDPITLFRLHSRHQENPLICLNSNVNGNEKEAKVMSLSWMRMRPCVFFALDSLSRINIWDLGVSDMYPEISLKLTEKKITSMRLLPTSDPRQVPFIVIGTEGGSIEIHKLKKEYGCRTASDVHNEMKMFLKYVSIL